MMWTRRRRFWRIDAEAHPWAINRPRITSGWAWVALSFGNGNSDPVCALTVTFTVPAWMDR